jgi:hypothetical protein
MPSLERVDGPDGVVGYRSPSLAALGVPHWFSTRRAPGLGPGGAIELDLGVLDHRRARLVAEAAGAPGAAIVRVRQVHGAGVFDADAWTDGRPEPARGDRDLAAAADAPGYAPVAADALVASRPDRLCLVRVADCVPVLLAAPDGRRVAAVHAGWRGVVAGVVPAALAALGPAAAAAIGPCISAAHFEVGDEVADAFRAAELGEAVLDPQPGAARPHVDLRRAVHLQLLRAHPGLAIDDTDRCTYAHADELWSHRRDVTHGGRAATGRQAAVIGAAIGARASAADRPARPRP